MIKRLYILLLFFVFIFNSEISVFASSTDYTTNTKQDLLCFMLAYPNNIINIEKSQDKIYIILSSNKKILYDDKLEKTPEEKLSNPCLKDVLQDRYPLGKIDCVFPKEINPGRIRHYILLSEVYGNSKESIQKNLVPLKYVYTSYLFNKQNNASSSLNNVLQELSSLAKSNTAINNILYPASGTFNYRIISGTQRLSPHSYGIAIDLKSDKRDYWKWSSAQNGTKRLNEYPYELIKAFENNNFIWGGKWGYFDILHFEYRPEVILKAKYFNNYEEGTDWYTGAPIEDTLVKKCIDIINNSL